jgi:parallel beta-helix repeat protein
MGLLPSSSFTPNATFSKTGKVRQTVYNIRDYGAAGNGNTVGNGAMTASSATLTSATASFTSADVGKSVSVVGAGASGVPLVATISSVNSSTNVTLSVSASTTVSSATIYYGTNDVTAIQSAISAASAGSTGGTVYLPSGIYIVTSAIALVNNVKLQGAGRSTVVAGIGTNFSIMDQIASSGSPLTDCTICDMKIDGTGISNGGTYSTGVKGIFIQYALRLKMYGLYVYNTSATGIGTDFLVDSLIDRCVVDTCGRDFPGSNYGGNGIGIGTGAYSIESWVVSNCIAKNTGNNGIMMEDQYATTHSKYMIVSNCISYGSTQGCGFRDSGTDNVTFSNCIAFNNTINGIQISTAGLSSYSPSNVVVVGCQSYGNTVSGILVYDSTPDATLQNVVIDGCSVSGNGTNGHGIWVENASRVIISNNQAFANNGNGIDVESTSSSAPTNYITIKGNQCFNNGQGAGSNLKDGIHLVNTGSGTMSNISIIGNRCWDDQGTQTQRYGLDEVSSVTNLLVTANDFTGNKTGATNFSGGTVIARGNTGYNPVGLVTVSVPSSGSATTAAVYDQTFYITTGLSTCACSVTNAGGTGQTVATIPASGFGVVFVPAGSTLTPTYSSAPTWTVQGN